MGAKRHVNKVACESLRIEFCSDPPLVVMLNKSPLMRPTFTPSQNRTTVEALSTRINNILNLLDTPSKSRQASSDQPHLAWRESETVMMAEIQRIQEVITDLIALFQDYRSSIDDQLENLAKDVCNVESRVESIVEERLSKIKQELRDEANDNIMKSFHRLDENGFFDQVVLKALQKQKLSQSLPIHRCEVSLDDLDNLKEELALVKDAEIQIIAKINAISSANTDCHEKSAEAIKSIRDVLTNHQLISR